MSLTRGRGLRCQIKKEKILGEKDKIVEIIEFFCRFAKEDLYTEKCKDDSADPFFVCALGPFLA